MRVLFSYTLQSIRKNRRTSLSIMASVLLASTLLCAMCTFAYTELNWRIEIEEYGSGAWHGELGGEICAEQLSVADHHLAVEATMIKGPFTCLALSEDSGLPYLLLRDADENYWTYMGEKNLILEGRLPKRPGEIVVSKSFFEQNPHYRLGDTVTLPAGDRVRDGERLDAAKTRQEGETFDETGEATVTLVGSMDITTNTTIPGYYAMGYLDRAALAGTEDLVVYVKFRDIRDTYRVMPQLADTLGIEKDEYGDYRNHFEYHTMLLALHFVFPPDMRVTLKDIGVLLVYGAILLLVMGAFAVIICSAFSVSAAARMRQLGMFRSVGATPGQIGAAILMEGVMLSALPIAAAIGAGHWFTVVIMRGYTELAGGLLYAPVTVRFSLPVALLSAAASFLTVLLAVAGPARKAMKLSPLEAIRMQETGAAGRGRGRRRGVRGGRHTRAAKNEGTTHCRRGVREKNHVRGWQSGCVAELARASYRANRSAFRAGVLSLTFCLMLLIGFFTLMRLNDYLSARNRSADSYNIYTRLSLAAEADPKLISALTSIPGEEKSVSYCVTRLAYQAAQKEESEEFKERGGFAGLDLNRWAIINRDGKYRIRVYLYGMQEACFDEYCRGLGADPKEFYRTDRVRAVAQSAAPLYPDVVNNVQKSGLSYSHLNLSVGQELMIQEKTEDDMKTDVVFSVEIGAVAQNAPDLNDVRNNYTICLYVPLPVYYSVLENLAGEKAGSYYMTVKVKTAPEDDLFVTEQIRSLCGSVMAAEDFLIISAAEEIRDNAASSRAMEMVIHAIGLLLGGIGISNTFSAVTHTLLRRRREFAMLRSVGMDSDGIGRLLTLEGIRMAVTPVLLSVPAVAVLLGILMHIVDVSWLEFLPWIPWRKVFVSIAAVMAAVALSYRLCAGKIRKDTIIEAVREENV